MGKDVENHIETCTPCTLNGRKEPPTPMERTRLPEAPWDFVAVDFCGPYSIFGGIYVLVMLDFYTRFMVASVVKSTDFQTTTQTFEKIFDIYGYPEAMKTDNGPPFNSKDYKVYCSDRGIKPAFSWPLTPQQNGIAERAMQSINKAMQSAAIEGTDCRRNLAEAIRAHNTAVHRTTNAVPSDLMFSRKLRRSLPLASSAKFVHNDEEMRSRDWSEKQKSKAREDKRRGAREARIMVGDKVVLRRATKRKGDSNFDPEEFEVTAKRKGDLTMTATDGRTVKRHITFAKKTVSSKPTTAPEQPTPMISDNGGRPKRIIKRPERYVARVM